MLFYTRISCDPPLSQSTVIPHGVDSVTFTVLLETNENTEASDWEVSLWQNIQPIQTWSALVLSSASASTGLSPLVIRRDINAYRKHFFFTGFLPKSTATNHGEFTIKYRKAGRDWIWVNSQSSATNGEIIFQKPSLPDNLSTSFTKFTQDAAVKPLRSEVDSTKLWSLEFHTPAASKTQGHQLNLLGIPRYVARWWALVRQWTPWLIPIHGHGVFGVTKDALVCSFQCRDGLNVVLLGISGVNNVETVFRDDGFGGIIVQAKNDDIKHQPARVLAAIGFSHETALAACMYAARNLAQRGSYDAFDTTRIEDTSKDDVSVNWNASWFDGLGYCTWNGIGQKLSEEKISNALRILRESDVKIRTLIIDDNWQTLVQSNPDHHYHTWSDFEANEEGFPEGLGSAITKIRHQNPSLKHVAVWHAMFGYWGGITSDGAIAQNYKTKQILRANAGKKGFEEATLTIVAEDDIERLFSDFYTFLSGAGIDSVKTDVQMMLDLIAEPEQRRSLIKAYQDAWNLKGLQYFQDKTISCMSHYPANFFHGLLPKNKPKILFRNSDDFWPNVPDSHAWHIFTNAHNALFTQHLNVIPDWDMFQTTHEFAAFHAAARCISGGPIYITDEPGRHDLGLIKQMTAETVRGETIILRPSCLAVAAPSSVYISNAEPRLLKVGCYHGQATLGSSILGVFNCSKGPLLDLVHLRDFRGARSEQKHIVRSFVSGQLSDPMTLDGENSVISVDLAVRGWDILTSYPVWTLVRDDKSTDLAFLGLNDKMSGAAAIMSYSVLPDQGQRAKIRVTLKALGILGIYISDLEGRTMEDDFLVMIYNIIIPVETVQAKGKVLEIDVDAAWNAIDEQPTWNNDITLEIYMIY